MPQQGFNPKARWDRNIPSDENYHPGLLDEKIEVLAYFKGAKIYPRAFLWNKKTYRVKNLTYNWQERRGSELVNLFTVSTGTDLYQISFNNTTFGWRLDKIIP